MYKYKKKMMVDCKSSQIRYVADHRGNLLPLQKYI